ncbi:unnamed protein product [Dovyalis caffra]|uniref:Exostosin GT47 domain-containing protein n=1 Tax=Dovyalis caffra TaxID=77055 RepID=A0AAV1SMW8_9ROSI|nr:unnamed protein product [Dovyalis caffra]
MEMEKSFKIFVYPHNTTICDKPKNLQGEYASEGLFFENLYQSRFLTNEPEKAHLFLIPISCHSLPAEGRSPNERSIVVLDFIKSLISEYPYWNRTLGADHFFLTCEDINVTDTARLANLLKNSIRVLCSPSYNDEFVLRKDLSLPQIVQPFNYSAAGFDPFLERGILSYYSGLDGSYIRKKLVRPFLGFESELDLTNIGLPTNTERGLAVVIFSDYYDLPFNNILDWKKFSVILKESEVNQLEEILACIPKQEYQALSTNTMMVQKHFEWNLPPVRLDAFHMVMYELWLRHNVTKGKPSRDALVQLLKFMELNFHSRLVNKDLIEFLGFWALEFEDCETNLPIRWLSLISLFPEMVYGISYDRISVFDELLKLMSKLELMADFSEFSHFYDFGFFMCCENGQKNISGLPTDIEEEQLLENVEKYKLANHLFWGLWGIISVCLPVFRLLIRT